MTNVTRRVLVTGASGFIGRRCLSPLLREGYEVHAVTLRGERGDAGPIHWHRCDLLDPTSFGPLVRSVAATHLLHAAWIATPGVFWASEENRQWLAHGSELAQLFFSNGGERAVGVGSCAEYEWTNAPYSEAGTPLRPSTLYGQTKAAMAQTLESAAKSSGGTFAWARLFFPYGPGEPAERFIPLVIRGLLKGEAVECTHGNQVRDFVFADDVAAALARLVSSQASGAFNVGSGRATSLREVAGIITAKLGRSDLLRFGARAAPAGDPDYVVADMTRMKTEVGWQHAVELEDGIERTIAAWREAVL